MATGKIKVKAKTIDTWKKKRWYKLVAPRLFNEQVIGETPSMDPEMLTHRTVAVSLMNLIRDMKKQHFTVTFEIIKVQGEMAYCAVKKITLNPSSTKRLIRRYKERIDDSFVVVTADKKNVRIKPLLVTRMSTPKSVLTAIRKSAREFLIQKASQLKYDDLLGSIVFNKVQKEMKSIVSKIYPIQISEIRSVGIEKEKKNWEETKSVVVEEAPAVEEKAPVVEKVPAVKEKAPVAAAA